jgi:two-component system, NtrC family, response regulator AtoC
VAPAAASPRAASDGSPPPRARSVQRVLIVGTDDAGRRGIHLALDRRGIEVAAVATVEQALRWLEAGPGDLVIVDAAGDPGAVAALRGRGAPILAIVPSGDLATSMRAVDDGADDCLLGAVDDAAIGLALYRRSRSPSPARIAEAEPQASGVERLIGTSPPMAELRETLRRVAQHRSTVLISGESGTGKELVARAIHEESGRRHRRFVAVNCAAIPGPLLESELFGHRRGAFTDAVRDRAGLFEEADGGSLFLDEVGELPLPLQVKLLRAIQESEIRRVGDTESIRVDVRLIAATLRDLHAEVAAGRFREDLFYRLNVLPVAVPPLRERPGDVAELVATFVDRHRRRHGGAGGFTADAIALLARLPWPGNVRELENAVERALVLTDAAEVDAAFVASHVGPREPRRDPTPVRAEVGLSIKKATRNLEIDLIRRALETTGGNRTNAARLLEISHRALLYKIKEYGL